MTTKYLLVKSLKIRKKTRATITTRVGLKSQLGHDRPLAWDRKLENYRPVPTANIRQVTINIGWDRKQGTTRTGKKLGLR